MVLDHWFHKIPHPDPVFPHSLPDGSWPSFPPVFNICLIENGFNFHLVRFYLFNIPVRVSVTNPSKNNLSNNSCLLVLYTSGSQTEFVGSVHLCAQLVRVVTSVSMNGCCIFIRQSKTNGPQCPSIWRCYCCRSCDSRVKWVQIYFSCSLYDDTSVSQVYVILFTSVCHWGLWTLVLVRYELGYQIVSLLHHCPWGIYFQYGPRSPGLTWFTGAIHA